ncbi:MAG: hypothetical protein J1E56_03025 [Ruminococcus sp.]|nr:hypothetical protein [Ruminococcus sp.]
MSQKTNCEFCSHYAYDDEYDCYYCQINLDEDEMERFMRQSVESCHYFQLYDEYKIVEKQN